MFLKIRPMKPIPGDTHEIMECAALVARNYLHFTNPGQAAAESHNVALQCCPNRDGYTQDDRGAFAAGFYHQIRMMYGW